MRGQASPTQRDFSYEANRSNLTPSQDTKGSSSQGASTWATAPSNSLPPPLPKGQPSVSQHATPAEIGASNSSLAERVKTRAWQAYERVAHVASHIVGGSNTV